jgi:transglutaminase-like putative cysteine protease
MTDTLRLPFRVALTALVCLNVVFVQLTGAVGSPWFALLYGATLGYPLWWRFASSGAWRLLWNCGVLALFGQLLWHASTTGVRFLLESGLLLAVFCQVHLLNVLQRSQNADLVFFNSFLIALVTSFFVTDVAYSIVFAVYAFTFVLALHLNAIASGDHEIGRAAWRAVGPQATVRALIAVVTTAGLFLVVPRDFQREGLVGDELAWSQQNLSGYTEEIELGRSGNTRISDRIVMRLSPYGGAKLSDVPTHWRGATSTHYRNQAWRRLDLALRDDSPDPRWQLRSAEEWERQHAMPPGARAREPLARVEARFFDRRVERLFMPLHASLLRLAPGTDTSRARPEEDGTCRFPLVVRGRRARESETMTWWVEIAHHLRPHDSELTDAIRSTYTNIALDDVPPELERILRDEIELPRDASPRQRVEACSSWLHDNRGYLLPGEQGAARSLDDFFAGAAGGHCEYFATALAVMLRVQGIPCRVVGGYLACEVDEEHGEIIVRDKHAHAWVEVWEDGTGWFTVDPTPGVARALAAGQTETGPGALGAMWSWLDRQWSAITRFDQKQRAALLARLRAAPGAAVAFAGRHPLGAFAGLVALVGLWLGMHRLRERRRSAVERSRRAWRRAVRALGLRPDATATPRETLALGESRARTSGTRRAQDRLAALRRATEEHERFCYATPESPPPVGPRA